MTRQTPEARRAPRARPSSFRTLAPGARDRPTTARATAVAGGRYQPVNVWYRRRKQARERAALAAKHSSAPKLSPANCRASLPRPRGVRPSWRGLSGSWRQMPFKAARGKAKCLCCWANSIAKTKPVWFRGAGQFQWSHKDHDRNAGKQQLPCLQIHGRSCTVSWFCPP
jgi:hypothetical protein